MLASEDMTRVTPTDITELGRPSTTRSCDLVSQQQSNYGTHMSNYDTDHLLLLAQSGERSDTDLAIASPVGRAVLLHSLEDADAREDDDAGIDRNNDAWKAIGEWILRPCLAKAADLRHRMS